MTAFPNAVVNEDILVSVLKHGNSLKKRYNAWADSWRSDNFKKIDSSNFPLISKHDIRGRPTSFISECKSNSSIVVKHTSGTTGPPVPVFFSELANLEQMLLIPYQIRALRSVLPSIDREPSPMITLSVSELNDRDCEIWVDPWGGCVVQLKIDESQAQDFARLAEAINRIRPSLLTVKPNILTEMVRNNMGDLLHDKSLELISVSGADLGKSARKRAESKLGVSITEAYALTEFGLVAAECEEDNGLHIVPEIYAYTLHEEGNEQAGELVLSSNINSVMPLNNYRTGDHATIDGTECSCGRTTPRLTSLCGRITKNFRLANGERISPSRFNILFEHFPISEFQVVQTVPGEFDFHLEVLPDNTVIVEDVKDIVLALLSGSGTIRISQGPIEFVSKFQRFISN